MYLYLKKIIILMSAINDFCVVSAVGYSVLDATNDSRSLQYRCVAADGSVYICRKSAARQETQRRSNASGGKRRRRTAAVAISSGLASSVEKILR